jgi:hypothetical protein
LPPKQVHFFRGKHWLPQVPGVHGDGDEADMRRLDPRCTRLPHRMVKTGAHCQSSAAFASERVAKGPKRPDLFCMTTVLTSASELCELMLAGAALDIRAELVTSCRLMTGCFFGEFPALVTLNRPFITNTPATFRQEPTCSVAAPPLEPTWPSCVGAYTRSRGPSSVSLEWSGGEFVVDPGWLRNGAVVLLLPHENSWAAPHNGCGGIPEPAQTHPGSTGKGPRKYHRTRAGARRSQNPSTTEPLRSHYGSTRAPRCAFPVVPVARARGLSSQTHPGARLCRWLS